MAATGMTAAATRRDGRGTRSAVRRNGPDHVVVYSSGRSGSNRLIDMFDQHERTNCRSEIDGYDRHFHALPTGGLLTPPPADFAERWNAAVSYAALRKGVSDRMSFGHKTYMRQPLAPVWAAVARRHRLRRLIPGLRGRKDWPLPAAILRDDPDDTVIPVFKLPSHAPWYGALRDQGWRAPLIHNVRDPRAYLDSWYNRYVRRNDHDLGDILAVNTGIVGPVLAARGLPPLPASSGIHAVLVSELSLWRFSNELVMEAMAEDDRYLLVRYEETSRDPAGTAERIFAHCGLEMTRDTRDRIVGMRNTLFAKPHDAGLDADEVEAALAVALPDGPLAELYR